MFSISIPFQNYSLYHNLNPFPEGIKYIYNIQITFFFPRPSRPDSHDPLLDQTNIMYSYAYGINHKDPPQRHHRIPALSQRQFIHEWPAPLFIHIIPTLIYIIDIYITASHIVIISYSLCTRFSLFV